MGSVVYRDVSSAFACKIVVFVEPSESMDQVVCFAYGRVPRCGLERVPRRDIPTRLGLLSVICSGHDGAL